MSGSIADYANCGLKKATRTHLHALSNQIVSFFRPFVPCCYLSIPLSSPVRASKTDVSTVAGYKSSRPTKPRCLLLPSHAHGIVEGLSFL